MIKWLDFSIINKEQEQRLQISIEGRIEETMFSNNVQGLLPFTIEKNGDDSYQVTYELTNKVSLKEKLKYGLTKDKFILYFLNIVNYIDSLHKNDVDIEKIVLHEQLIYLDGNDNLFFVYVPVQILHVEKITLLQFFKNFYAASSIDEKDDLLFFIKLHNFFAQSQGEMDRSVLQQKLLELADKKGVAKKEVVTSMNRNFRFYSPTNTNIDKTVIDNAEETAESIPPVTSSEGMNDEWGTTVLGTFDEEEKVGTTILSDSANIPHLVFLTTNEKINISKNTFVIGRDPNQTDYTLHSNVIGRVHAKILSADGKYYIKDYHSRNGTYVNGVKLQPMERVKIKHEDKIKLANIEFEFRIF